MIRQCCIKKTRNYTKHSLMNEKIANPQTAKKMVLKIVTKHELTCQ